MDVNNTKQKSLLDRLNYDVKNYADGKSGELIESIVNNSFLFVRSLFSRLHKKISDDELRSICCATILGVLNNPNRNVADDEPLSVERMINLVKNEIKRLNRQNIAYGRMSVVREEDAQVRDGTSESERMESLGELLKFARKKDVPLLRMKYDDGLSCRDISKKLQCSEDAVRMRVQRSLQKMRERMNVSHHE